MTTDAAIDAFLAERLDHYIAETARLCAQPSVSARQEGLHECAALVGEVLAAHGLAVESLDTQGSPVLVGRAAGASGRTLLFYNHYDVQPPEPLELWTTPPYSPTVRDGALYARGAKDDKGELVARLAALDAVRAARGGSLPCGVTFVVEGQEEVGSPHIAAFVKANVERLRCDAAIWEEGGTDVDGHPGTSLGRRGVLGVELEVATLARDAHSGGAHMFPNAAWRLVRALATLKGADDRILIPGFYDRVRPPSALDQELLNALPDREAWLREEFGVHEFVGGRRGPDLERAVFNPTCNIQGLNSGYQGVGMKTVIPARASAKLDFRLVPDQDPDEVFGLLRAHLDAHGFDDVSLVRYGSMWPDKAPADHPFVALAARAGEEVYGRAYRLLPLVGGSSPVYAFARPLGGIPVIAAGVGFGISNRTHSPDEHVRLVDFLNGARHIARILDRFADL